MSIHAYEQMSTGVSDINVSELLYYYYYIYY